MGVCDRRFGLVDCSQCGERVSWPTPPAVLRAGVGGSDFWKTGFELLALLSKHARLRNDDRVLDVGCGLGRVAYLLSAVLDEGSYCGLDIVPDFVTWCRANLELDASRFEFIHADISNSMYNPRGRVPAEAFRFPAADDAFTLTIATSLFTHLSAAAVVNYLHEIHRTLATGGRLFASFYVLDEESLQRVQTGETDPPFAVPTEHGLLSSATDPDAATAFDALWLHEAFLAAGYTFDAYLPGTWRADDGPTYQDLVVARKA